MKRLIAAAVATLALVGCSTIRDLAPSSNPYNDRLFYEKYLTTTDPLDIQISQRIAALRVNPDSAVLHNELGQLLRQKGFPKDAEVEFARTTPTDASTPPGTTSASFARRAAITPVRASPSDARSTTSRVMPKRSSSSD
jgi:hypothetical protein